MRKRERERKIEAQRKYKSSVLIYCPTRTSLNRHVAPIAFCSVQRGYVCVLECGKERRVSVTYWLKANVRVKIVK